ncbi:MAG: hypothetical protein SNH94_03700 [Rikenellaceae bacterium]
MISRLIRLIFTLAALVVVALAALNHGRYTSLIPDDWSFSEWVTGLFAGDSASPKMVVELPEPIEDEVFIEPDTLQMHQIDSLQQQNIE